MNHLGFEGAETRDIVLGVLLFVATLIFSLAAAAWVITRLPVDYFSLDPNAPRSNRQHPARRIGKNLLGVLLIFVGCLLAIPGVPGQGILTILIGIVLVDFPGKWRLERRMVKAPRILDAVNRVRHRFGREPFLPPDA